MIGQAMHWIGFVLCGLGAYHAAIGDYSTATYQVAMSLWFGFHAERAGLLALIRKLEGK